MAFANNYNPSNPGPNMPAPIVRPSRRPVARRNDLEGFPPPPPRDRLIKQTAPAGQQNPASLGAAFASVVPPRT